MNELPLTAQSAKGLPRPLAKRSAIDPFIVMDVMGEANARELSTMTLFIWRWVSPQHPRREPRVNARGKRWKMSGSAIPRRSACPTSGSGSPAI
jgi:hypothetical protein